MSPRPSFTIDVNSLESAQAVASGWQSYHRVSLLFAGLGTVIVLREILPVPRFFGRDCD